MDFRIAANKTTNVILGPICIAKNVDKLCSKLIIIVHLRNSFLLVKEHVANITHLVSKAIDSNKTGCTEK